LVKEQDNNATLPVLSHSGNKIGKIGAIISSVILIVTMPLSQFVIHAKAVETKLLLTLDPLLQLAKGVLTRL
jgi:hypothetical protein